ncbi:MAG TPA: hypothetical protein VG797_10670 [Phycisphaerales bacterium]|nr:hypothetical protein [Phycisphaerales bacterium]
MRTAALLFSFLCFIAIGLTSVAAPGTGEADARAASRPITPADAPRLEDAKPRDYPGLHNVVAYHDNYYSGSVPEEDAGFDTLVALGVKTIISVDGAEPNLDLAKAHGLRYIHLPIGYNGFNDSRKLELVRATRDAMKSGPVYIHCHHGKHRSAGAAAAVAASLGWLTPEGAVERMKISGTAPNYKGLYACASNAAPLDAAAIDAVDPNFPEISKPAGFVKAMTEIDEITDRLKLIEKAGWKAPPDHPDLVPVAEAGRMADLFRFVHDDERAKAKPEDFAEALRTDGARVQTIEDLLATAEPDKAKLSEQFKLVVASCKDCHAKYRD